jgi:hypothetical protein
MKSGKCFGGIGWSIALSMMLGERWNWPDGRLAMVVESL